MHATVDKKEFMRALVRAGAATSRKSTMPILGYVLLEAAESKLVLRSSDLAVYYREELDARGAEGEALALPAVKLLETVKATPTDEIYLVEKDGRLELQSGRVTARLDYLPAADFPAEPAADNQAILSLEAKELDKALAMVEPAISAENARFNLASLFMEPDKKNNRLNLVATDGRRLNRLKLATPVDGWGGLGGGVLIPGSSVKALRQFLGLGGEAIFGLGAKWSTVRIGQATAHIQAMEGSFPDYRAVMPRPDKLAYFFKVRREELKAAMERARIYTDQKGPGAKFSFNEGLLTLTASTLDVGEYKETMEADTESAGMDAGLNVRYVEDVLKVMESDEVRAACESEHNPFVFTGEGDPDFIGIVMPMRL